MYFCFHIFPGNYLIACWLLFKRKLLSIS